MVGSTSTSCFQNMANIFTCGKNNNNNKEDYSKNGTGTVGELLFNSIGLDAKKQFMIDADTGEVVTYAKFFESTVKLAKKLKSLGFQKGDIVAVVSENILNYFVPVVAGLFIGVTVTCVNPNYKGDELEHCFKITEPKLVFASKMCLDAVRKIGYSSVDRIVLLNGENDVDDIQLLSNFCDNNFEIKSFQCEKFNVSDTTAFILFSSGTTGLPKGVMITHENVLHSLSCLIAPGVIDMTSDSVTLGFLPNFHLFGMLLTLHTMRVTAKIIALSAFKPEKFLKTIAEHQINILFLVPPLMLFLAKCPILDRFNMSSIKSIFCGAAPMSKNIEQMVEERFSKVYVRQIYGLTEISSLATIMPIDHKKYESVGKAAINTDVRIYDIESGRPVGPNQSGEICIKSPGVMKGYYKNEAETKAAFNADGYFRTGDIGYFDEDQYLYVVDRLKELIKYKGFQVPPAQLEDLLLKHEKVKDVAVVGKPDDKAGELPVAFVVKHPDNPVTEKELIDYVADHMSKEKQLHGGVIFVDEIPKNPSGKILRRTLRQRFN